MVDVSSQNNKINVTVSSSGNTAKVNATPDSARYYSDKSKEWAIGEKLIDNTDYSSKYYANESKKQADISTAKTTEVIESGNTAVSNIKSARDNAITDITNQENLSVDNVNTAGTTQVANVNSAGTTQVNLAKEQVTLATNKANIATEQATIATSQASIATSKTTEVVESGNTAISNIETAKSNALNDINTAGAEYVNNAEQYAQNALNSANNAKASEDNALSYKSSAMESSQTATEQANIATTSANNAKTSETNAKSSEVRCEEILSRLGTAIKIKGRVNSLGDLPLSGNLDGDTYLIGKEGLDSYPEYYWYQDHWEFLGTSGTTLSWGLITGNIKAQTDLQTELDTKQDVISDLETIRSNANLVTTKQDTIPDLATIRSGASKGATALQSIPAEYVTETELNAKGYLTSYTETDPVYSADKANIALKSEIPTKTSQLTNDSDYITAGRIGEQLATKTDMQQASGAGMPSSKYIDLTLGDSGSTYTAPANGYFALELQTNNQGQVALYNIVSNISGDYYGTKSQNPLSNNNWVAVFMPVQKNATIKITYKNRVATDHFRFIYAEGSK